MMATPNRADDGDESHSDHSGYSGQSASYSDSSTSTIEDRQVPPGVAEGLQTLFGTENRPETFGMWTNAIAETFGDEWPPNVDMLCHDDGGIHRAETADETYRFTCVLDAFLLPFLTEETVEVHSADPLTGEEISATVSRDGIDTDPEEAVMSFGVAVRDGNEDAELTPERLYGALCPYIHAFADREAYEKWDAESDGVTTAMALLDGFELARALVRA